MKWRKWNFKANSYHEPIYEKKANGLNENLSFFWCNFFVPRSKEAGHIQFVGSQLKIWIKPRFTDTLSNWMHWKHWIKLVWGYSLRASKPHKTTRHENKSKICGLKMEPIDFCISPMDATLTSKYCSSRILLNEHILLPFFF